MRKALLVIYTILGLSNFPVVAQIDFTKYFDDTSLPFLKVSDHLNVNVAWKMKGNIQVFMNEGVNYLEEGKLELALTNLDELIKADSSLWEGYYYRGVVHKKLYHVKEAENDFRASLKLNPQSETYLELGEVYHLQNSFKKAEDQYEKAIEINPKLVSAYYNLGNLWLATGELKKSLRYYQKCNEIDPQFPDAYMTQGILKFKVRKSDNQSIALFDQALKIDSAFSQAYFWRGLAYMSLNQTEKCVKDWSKLIIYNPENSFFTMMRGYLYIELGDFDKAFVDLRKALRSGNVNEDRFEGAQTVLDKKIDLYVAANYLIANGYGLKEEAFAPLKKGFCLLLADKPEEALKSIEVSEKSERSAAAYFIKAIASEHMGEHNSAYQYYSQALLLDNDIFDAHKKMSVYRSELKDWKGANKAFENMFRLQPESPVVYRLRGLMKSNQSDYEGAIKDLSKFIATDSSDYEALRTRSVCYLLLKKERESNDDMRRMLRISEGNWQLYQDVAVNYESLGDTVSAIAVWKEFAEARPRVFIPVKALAKIYILKKDWVKAKAEIDKLLTLISPDHMPKEYAEILFWEGLIEFEKSNYELAISKFNQSLKQDKTNLESRYFRAKSFERTGQRTKAVADFKDLKKAGFRDSEVLYNGLLKTTKS